MSDDSPETNLIDLGDASPTNNLPVHWAHGDNVDTTNFDELQLDIEQIEGAEKAWKSFLEQAESEEDAGDAIFTALYDGLPTFQPMFVTPRAVSSMNFLHGIHHLVMALHEPGRLRGLVETLAFHHLHLDVTTVRVGLFRNAILDLLALELGDELEGAGYDGLARMFNYVGGAIIFIRTNYAERVDLLQESWLKANGKDNVLREADQDSSSERGSSSQSGGGGPTNRKSRWGFKKKRHGTSSEDSGSGDSQEKTRDFSAVPTNFRDMFIFNVAVMNLDRSLWLQEVLTCFEAIVMNISNTTRLQEECSLLALRIARVATENVVMSKYKSCMLSTMRQLLPKDWSQGHEVAWNWLWDNFERMLATVLVKPSVYEASLKRLFQSLDDAHLFEMRKASYEAFFSAAPSGQDFFKQSNTRLHYIAQQIMKMTEDLFLHPARIVDDISALGLRHVAYGVPTELFGPFVSASIKVMTGATSDLKAVEAYRWSLGLISNILVRTINEGSTIVMKAINTNSPKMLRKAVNGAPRGSRAAWMLSVQVGSQCISPLAWSIESGSLEAAQAILKDLLTMRADREMYYYGVDELFTRHPDFIRTLTVDAPTLLPSLLDGLIWRSRLSVNGERRANFYVKHLLVTEAGEPSSAMKWIAASNDPKIICHPVLILVSDTLWHGLVVRQFILSKLWFIFSLVVFMLIQAILPNLQNITVEIQWVILIGRVLNYLLVGGRLAVVDTPRFFQRITLRDKSVSFFEACRENLKDTSTLADLFLVGPLLGMVWQEPMFYCVGEDEWPTSQCESAEEVRFRYEVCSMLAMAIHWVLLIDLTIFSTELSAFVLVCNNVLSEVSRFLLALLFLLLTFGSAISVLPTDHDEYRDVQNAVLTLLAINVGFYEKHYAELQREPVLMAAVFLFSFISVIVLLNLLIAQLNCSYEAVYRDMLGYARLQRAQVVVERISSCSKLRWTSFVKSLDFEKRLEFNEGDVGLAGGIQILELASLHPVVVDSIRRYGGSSSPNEQWPEDVEEEDKLEKLERMVKKTMSKVSKSRNRAAGRDDESSSGEDF